MSNKKIALVHDYIKEYGGAERVLETLHEMYPDAPVFTLVYCPEFLGPHRKRFGSWDIRESWVGKVLFKHKFISLYRLIAPFVFKSFDLSSYDVVIVSATGAYCPNFIRTRIKNQESRIKENNHTPFAIHKPYHICYCHTPPRYLYGYATARQWKKNPVARIFGEIANAFLRMIDYKSAQHVDQFIANSQEVAGRIKKFYKRDAVVVYPPVTTATSEQQLANSLKRKNKLDAIALGANRYFLAGGRLARPKHYDLIIQACIACNVPLKIFGKGFAGYEEELHFLANRLQQRVNEISRSARNDKDGSIEFVGEVSDEKKLELMRGAKAFIMASEDEDFGITPVEAMGVGTPVIAYKSGGLKETVINGKTGVFFDELTVESLTSAIKRFENLKISPETCIQQAQKFSKEAFTKGMQRVISSASVNSV